MINEKYDTAAACLTLAAIDGAQMMIESLRKDRDCLSNELVTAQQEIASLRAQHEGGKSEALADLAYAHGMTTGWNLCIADKHDEFARIRSMRSSQAISTIEAPQPAAQPTIVQMKDYCKQASAMMARDLTRFDAACEVMGYLKEMRAPGYYMHRMNIVLHGNVEGTGAARASDKAPQPAAQDALAYQAACSLATHLFKKHFSKDVEYASGKVTWGLCDTTAGVISQIDNMVCGLVEPAAQALDANEAIVDASISAAVPASGPVGFDHKTAANFLNGKTVTDEEVRQFVAHSRWAHDDRDGLRNTIADLRREIAQRDAEIALLKTSLLDVESPTTSRPSKEKS